MQQFIGRLEENELDKYLKPTPAIDCNDKNIRRKANNLTSGLKISEKAKILFYFVRDKIKYNPYVPSFSLEDHQASKTLARGEGYCVQKAVLLTALARASNIPSRLRFADIRNYLLSEKLKNLLRGKNLLVFHGYNELYIGDKWVKATPAFDLEMCRKHNIVPVDFDGKTDAVFQDHDMHGRPHIEYVRDRGHYEHLPISEMKKTRCQAYGSDYYERKKQVRKEHEK